MQAISFWQNQRDRFKAKEAIKNVNNLSLEKDIILETEQLIKIAPKQTIDLLTQRVQICFDRYEKVLNDDMYLPEEIDQATNALIMCICRELNRLVKVSGGHLPTKTLENYWSKYKCKLN